ncbi:zinc-binding dehydrogenase [Nocardia halotolerans]|uniref:Zinc-binding dehydrogenase n=1 Tax=Nocardia halotolerans TaxID=1755878 RepID=A0ABV8VL27_9NOCA
MRSRGVGARGSRTRAEIICATAELTLEQGYAAVTYRSVASRAGVTASLVQYYFPDMDDLFIAVLIDSTDELVVRLSRVGESAHPLRAVWAYANDPAGTKLLLEFMALANHRKRVGQVIGSGGERVRKALLAAVTPTLRKYGLPEDEFPAAAVVFLMSAVPRMIHFEQMFGASTGHAEMVERIEAFLDRVEPTMRTVSQDAFGGPEVLRTIEAPRPVLLAGEVLIRMAATSVNPVDTKARSGAVRYLGEPPFTLGFDVAGTIVEVGAEVDAFAPGDEVFGMVASRTGTYSEYVVAGTDTIAPRPHRVSALQAAALPTAGSTAWQALRLAGLSDGERILIHAGAGGVGHLAVQLATLRGAHVAATARAANHAFLRELGAAEVIDYQSVDFEKVVTDVDVVLDLVGGGYGSRSLRVLRPGGRYVTAQGSDAADDPRCRRVTGRPSIDDLSALADLVGDGRLRVHIDRVMSLTEIAEAHRLSESGRTRGKIVLVPWR